MSGVVNHLPGRPDWRCHTCGDDWPCRPARTRMIEEYGDDREHRQAICIYLSMQLADALDDLIRRADTAPGDLYTRFVGWIRPHLSPADAPPADAPPTDAPALDKPALDKPHTAARAGVLSEHATPRT